MLQSVWMIGSTIRSCEESMRAAVETRHSMIGVCMTILIMMLLVDPRPALAIGERVGIGFGVVSRQLVEIRLHRTGVR
jgi:hypothetical protein